MAIKKQNKFKSNLKLLQGDSLEKYNEYLSQLLLERGISPSVEFNLEKLQQFIDQEGTFGKGLIVYLQQLEKQLDLITDDKDLKLYIFQILSELGSLVFPNTSACYSIIPGDLKRVKWDEKLQDFNNKIENKNCDIKEIQSLLNIFLSKKYSETLACLVALCLCDVLVRSIDKMNSLLVDENGEFVGQEEAMRPRLKAPTWVDRLAWNIRVHLHGLSSTKLTYDQKKIIDSYSLELSKQITQVLLHEQLFDSYKTIQSAPQKDQKIKTAAYFAWTGSNLLALPKTLALPMVYPPNDWTINPNEGADNGGYLLSALTNISYQGYLDSKSSRIHDHRLYLKNITHLNNLQKVKFSINERMVAFYNKYQLELTNSERLLLSDKWINPDGDLILEITKKWAKMFTKAGDVSDAIVKERISRKNATLRNQEILKVADLYCNKIIYWPAVQDFRGRVYRIGHLNIQLDEFTRSLIAFHSDKPLIKRRKQSNKSWAQYNQLLKMILVENDIIEKWDTLFGDRLINNDKFEQLLLEDLLVEKLSFIQVGQLLLIRQGAYDRVGVFYDASASAYQIMGTINSDRQLCQLTNVIKSPDGIKQDIYTFFLNWLENKQYSAFDPTVKKNITDNVKRFLLEKENQEKARYKEYFRNNFDRSLTKAIVMPLIYGKTSMGFAEDLNQFFAKGSLYPDNKLLIALASQILKLLKNDETFKTINHFMKMLRSIGKLLFDLDLFIIRGPYSDSFVVYHKEETERLRIYLKRGKRYQSQRISINRIVKDQEGNLEKSRTKTINAFVANYVHFLDGVICHYIIKKLEQEGTLELGTIHDCFFIKPEKAEILKKVYKEGLVLALIVHQYNLLHWLHDIMESLQVKEISSVEMLLAIKRILKNLENFQAKQNIDADVEIPESESIIRILGSVKNYVTPLKNKAYWDDIIEYFKVCKSEESYYIMKEILADDTESLFPDNK